MRLNLIKNIVLLSLKMKISYLVLISIIGNHDIGNVNIILDILLDENRDLNIDINSILCRQVLNI